ncbi:aconitate hydratase AcnA [Nocardia vermiculata]|uniref:aconitate hydratase AcnA n=1 Tax=Nocardia vermiculata TaxID=257274 RepID=UPI001FE0708B|nr:aconitate hydratase AcnA [Nocardia vermiculata]
MRALPDGRTYFSLAAAEQAGAGPLRQLPYVTRVLVENVLRHENGRTATADHVRALAVRDASVSVPFFPQRVLLQDASGIPVLADMVTLAERAVELGRDADSVAPRRRMDLVVDHALELDSWSTPTAATANLEREYERHAERYRFLRWAQRRFSHLRVIPPGTGICHQLNLETLADVVTGTPLAGFDSVVGTDSHTTMINGLSVAGWGVGGIEATAAALGEPILLQVPQVIGVRLTGTPKPGVLAADVALTLTALLRDYGVVQRIVEFHGPALSILSVPDRATIANMAPEYGATMGYFPPDARTLDYLAGTARPHRPAAAYLSAQGMLDGDEPEYDDLIEFDLDTVERVVAGPSRPHQVRPISTLGSVDGAVDVGGPVDGAVVIASITSCTNTSNPRAITAAGLLARNASARGLAPAPWTKTSFTPGSHSTAELLSASGLQSHLDAFGFHIAGFGCGTCMGNSGPLPTEIAHQIRGRNIRVSAVLSGNRNFPGRIHPDVVDAYLVSPPLVVAFAIAGRTTIDLDAEPLGRGTDGEPVMLSDIWPSEHDIDCAIESADSPPHTATARRRQAQRLWEDIAFPDGDRYVWQPETGMIRRPPFSDSSLCQPIVAGDILAARPLLILGDDITTDHISPVSRILPASAAGAWLLRGGITAGELGSYSSRRLNHDVMLRGGFANPRLRNKLADRDGGWTRLLPDGPVMAVHDAAAQYQRRNIPAVVVAGRSYGAGSARDWAAKVTRLLGIRAVIAASFERIHRTNLAAMGILPIQCEGLHEVEADQYDIIGIDPERIRNAELTIVARFRGKIVHTASARTRIDSQTESEWLRAGGVLPRILETLDEGGKRHQESANVSDTIISEW